MPTYAKTLLVILQNSHKKSPVRIILDEFHHSTIIVKFYRNGINTEDWEKLRKKEENNMKRRRKNQKREKIVMLCSSLLVLTALTMTGVYVKERNKPEEDGYRVDLSALEKQSEESQEMVEEPQPEPKTAIVSSGKVENPSKEEVQEQTSSLFPWEINVSQEDEVVQETTPKEEELQFSENETLLWPIVGNVLIDYSMDKAVYFSSLEQYKCNPAIIIQAKEGQQVMAAANGKVTKIVKEEQTGNTIYMDLGSGYESVYGQLTNLQVKEGDRVKKGDYIADVAVPTRYYSVEGCNVYFALKKDGTPINPMTQLTESR